MGSSLQAPVARSPLHAVDYSRICSRSDKSTRGPLRLLTATVLALSPRRTLRMRPSKATAPVLRGRPRTPIPEQRRKPFAFQRSRERNTRSQGIALRQRDPNGSGGAGGCFMEADSRREVGERRQRSHDVCSCRRCRQAQGYLRRLCGVWTSACAESLRRDLDIAAFALRLPVSSMCHAITLACCCLPRRKISRDPPDLAHDDVVAFITR